MGRSYEHLSEEERVKIYHWHANGKSRRWIGEALGRDASTISRELKRNGKATKQWSGGYEPVRAQALAERRRRWDGRFKLARQPALRTQVHDFLAMGWSPEQIAARLTQDKDSISISHEAIYRYIYHCSAQKEYWHKLLPRKKYRRGRLGKRGGSPILYIKDRVSVHKRPAYIEKRRQSGHWESDCILFSKYGQTVLVAQERASRYIFLAKPPCRRAEQIAVQLQEWLAALPPQMRRTLTQDNGTEFFAHHKLRDALGMKTYFCDPHSPWQKGGIENANGRLRRSLPRNTNLALCSDTDIEAVASRYNNTPRKCLGFKTPAEVFSAQLLHFKRESTFQHL